MSNIEINTNESEVLTITEDIDAFLLIKRYSGKIEFDSTRYYIL